MMDTIENTSIEEQEVEEEPHEDVVAPLLTQNPSAVAINPDTPVCLGLPSLGRPSVAKSWHS